MIKSYRRLLREHASAIGRKRGIASQRVQREKHRTCEPDADTLRCRALHDAKGKVVREGATYRAAGIVQWCVRRSVAGNVRQFDFVANGTVKLTGGPRRFPLRIRPT